MSKRLLKRHKRQVSRAKAHAQVSQPDMRTPEQIKAAREAARPAGGWRNAPHAHHPPPPIRNDAKPSEETTPKEEI